MMSATGNDEWEDQLLEEMAKMFRDMGMPVDISLLKQMMEQIRQQFEQMGIDPDRMANTEMKIDVNSDPEEFRKQMESMMNGPDGFAELLRNMGVNIQVNGPKTVVEAEVEEESDEEDFDLPIEDVYVHEDRMFVTIDISRQLDVDESEIELNLTSSGTVLQLMKKTQLRPFKRFDLPRKVSHIIEWSLNNGILDITFQLNDE